MDELGKKLVCFIVPVYNEEKNIVLFFNNLNNVLKSLENRYNFEVIFINDGSSDTSANIIQGLARQNNRVKYLELSRNFGKEIAMTAGFHHAKGDAVISIDADLQFPVALIPEFLKKWEQGAEVVVGMREKNKRKGIINKIGCFVFYKIINVIGDTKIFSQETDYRLLDKCVVKQLNCFTEQNRMTRGLIDWLGFKRDYIYFEIQDREQGRSNYGFKKLANLAVSTFVNHSLFPLKLAGFIGIFITFSSGTLGLFILVEKYILNDPLSLNFSGLATLAVFILFLVGIVLICLGLIALYIANIQKEVIKRPLYIIKKKSNFD